MLSLNIQSNLPNKLLLSLGVFLILAMIMPLTALADTGQSSAVDTILRSESLQGDGHIRDTIAGYLHKPITFVMTVCGFLIISFSFLKFIITLLYLTFPDMFDTIDNFRKENMQGNLKEKSPIDMISYIFALILPNIKSLTDYSKDDSGLEVTPMDYIKKKLPMVIAFVIIGAMIFDGQARSFMAKAADVGMLFGNMFERHDTVGAVQGFLGGDSRYEFVIDESKQEGKNDVKIAKAIQSALHGINPQLNSQEVSDAIGKHIEQNLTAYQKILTDAGSKGGINKYEDIVSFSLSVTTRKTELTKGAAGTVGVKQFEIPADVRDQSPMKYYVIRVSQIRDKDNRNFLYEQPKNAEGTKK